MFLEQRYNYFSPPQFNQASAACLGTVQKWSFDRTWPVEEIVLHVVFTTGSSADMANSVSSATTPDMFDNILNVIQRINISVNEGNQPRTVVDCSGVGMLEWVSQAGLNLDAATLSMIALSQGSSVAKSGTYNLTYRIPLAQPFFGDPLRIRTLLPVHLHRQDPVITLWFNSLTNMGFTAGSISNLFVDVQLIRRIPTADSEATLQKIPASIGGYISWDLVESQYSTGVGNAAEQRYQLPIPGSYTALLFRQYLGGSAITRNTIDYAGIGDTVAHGAGSEDRWRLESGLVVKNEWRWRHLRANSDWTRPANSSNQTYSPNFSGGVLSATNFRAASSTMIDFAGGNLNGDTVNELGSVLDCNAAALSNLKMELIGKPANVATNPSSLIVVGHRMFGDLSPWQKF